MNRSRSIATPTPPHPQTTAFTGTRGIKQWGGIGIKLLQQRPLVQFCRDMVGGQ
jgi:hypothetical protein